MTSYSDIELALDAHKRAQANMLEIDNLPGYPRASQDRSPPVTRDTTQFPIIETADLDIMAEITADWIPACGDGWNEPREDAHWEMNSVTFYRLDRSWMPESRVPKGARILQDQRQAVFGQPWVRVSARTDLPDPQPDWLLAVLDAMNWQDQLDDAD